MKNILLVILILGLSSFTLKKLSRYDQSDSLPNDYKPKESVEITPSKLEFGYVMVGYEFSDNLSSNQNKQIKNGFFPSSETQISNFLMCFGKNGKYFVNSNYRNNEGDFSAIENETSTIIKTKRGEFTLEKNGAYYYLDFSTYKLKFIKMDIEVKASPVVENNSSAVSEMKDVDFDDFDDDVK